VNVAVNSTIKLHTVGWSRFMKSGEGVPSCSMILFHWSMSVYVMVKEITR